MSRSRAIQWKPLLVALIVPLAVGGLAALCAQDGMQANEALNQPPLSPPQWVFAVVWTVLYLLMGLSTYWVYLSPSTLADRRTAWWLYDAQLAVNFFWTLFYFLLGWRLFAFFWLLLLIGLVGWMIRAFRRVSRGAAWLQLPYLLWLIFAAYLNLATWLLN